MFPPAFAVVLMVAATVASAGLVALGRTGLGTASSRLAAAAVVISMTVTVTGLVMARARWAQRHGWVLLGILSGMVVATEPIDGWWMASLLLAVAAALSLATGPVRRWLDSVQRRTPVPSSAVLLMLLLLNAPLVVALVHPDGPPPLALVGAALAWVVLWAYSQAWTPAVWLARFGTPILAVGWAWQSAWWGWAIVGFGALVMLRYAWAEGSLLAVQPLEPRKVVARPILAELAPEDVRRIAGIDERGRRKQ